MTDDEIKQRIARYLRTRRLVKGDAPQSYRGGLRYMYGDNDNADAALAFMDRAKTLGLLDVSELSPTAPWPTHTALQMLDPDRAAVTDMMAQLRNKLLEQYKGMYRDALAKHKNELHFNDPIDEMMYSEAIERIGEPHGFDGTNTAEQRRRHDQVEWHNYKLADIKSAYERNNPGKQLPFGVHGMHMIDDDTDEAAEFVSQHSPKFLKRLLTSGNPHKAVHSMYNFYRDMSPEKEQYDPYNINSINEFTAFVDKVAQRNQRRADNKELIKHYLQSKHKDKDWAWNLDIEGNVTAQELTGDIGNFTWKDIDPAVLTPLVEDARKNYVTDLMKPYEYNDSIVPAIGNGWRLFKDIEDQMFTGMQNSHCYGDIYKYGTGAVRDYNNAIKNKECLLIRKDMPDAHGNGATAQIDLYHGDPKNPELITEVDVPQVEFYDNENVPKTHPLHKEAWDIANSLVGKIHSDKRLKRVERKVSDERLKVQHGPRGNNMNNSSMALEAEENRLLSIANSMKTRLPVGAIRQYLFNNCPIENEDDKNAVVGHAMYRLLHTESGESSGAMGKAHDPCKETRAIAQTISQLRGF